MKPDEKLMKVMINKILSIRENNEENCLPHSFPGIFQQTRFWLSQSYQEMFRFGKYFSEPECQFVYFVDSLISISQKTFDIQFYSKSIEKFKNIK